jgi:hypothetical protein
LISPLLLLPIDALTHRKQALYEFLLSGCSFTLLEHLKHSLEALAPKLLNWRPRRDSNPRRRRERATTDWITL